MITEERLTIEYIPLDDLLEHPRNPKDHNIPLIQGSIERFGFTTPPLIDERTGLLTAGHGRLETLQRLRDTRRPLPRRIMIDPESGDWLVPVVRGVRFDSDDEAAAYLITDNETTVQGGWHEGKLAALVKQLNENDPTLLPVTGLGEDTIKDLLRRAEHTDNGGAGVPPAPGDALSALGRAQEYLDKWGVESGQVWRVGRHRLICGDNGNPELMARLLHGLPAPSLAHLDPPYGINAVAGRHAEIEGMGATGRTNRTQHLSSMLGSVGKHKGSHGSSMTGKLGGAQHGKQSSNAILQSNIYPQIHGDDKPFDPTPLLNLAPAVVLWGANYFADKLPNSPGWIIWDKREAVVRNSFADCELAWTNQRRPARVFSHLWNGIHKASQHDERRTHPTEKPIALYEYVGNELAPGAVWLDIYAGSGAQLIAAEKNGAICLAMEIEPLYVATILERAEHHQINGIELE